MVKSYNRLELAATFGIVSSASGIVHIPSAKGPGKAVVGAGEALQLWDLKTSELEARLVDPQQDPKAVVLQLSFEPQSELVAAGYSDGTVRVWDLRSSSVMTIFSGHRSAVSILQFSIDGTQLYSGSADTTIVAWDLVNEQGIFRLKGHKAMITGLVCTQDEKHLISTAKDGVIKVWDLQTQYSTETHIAHKSECWGLTEFAVPPAVEADVCLATVSNGTEIKLFSFNYEGEEGKQLHQLGELEKQSKHRGVGVVFDEETQLLVCASGDAAQSWRLRTADEVKRAIRRKQKRSTKSDKSERSDGAADDDTSVSPFVSNGLIRTRAKISGVCLGAKGQIVFNVANNSLEFYELKGEEGTKLGSVDNAGHRTDVRDAAISSDGKLIATGSNGLIKVYNSHSTRVIRTLTDTQYILSLKFLPGDQLVVAGTKEGTIDIYDISKATKVSSVETAHAGAVWSLDLSSDGTQLVSGGADKCVKFWQLKVVEEEVPGLEGVVVPKMVLKNTHKLEFHDDVLAVKMSPDMKLVAASLLDSTVKVYFRDTLKFFLNLYGHQLPVISLDISHDNKLLVTSSADKNIKLWGLDFGDCHKSIFAHDDSVLRVVFEPYTHNFLSASKDGLVKYWDGDKFVQIQRLVAHHSEVWALTMSPDGQFAVSASHDKSVRIWEVTDEPLFIEEEREAEVEQQYEEKLVDELENDRAQADKMGDDDEEDEEDIGAGTAVSKYSIESLKAGERLYEALDICTQDLEEQPNPRHVILATLNVSAERYLMDVLSKIKAPVVEDALLTFPLDRVVKLLKFVQIWLEKKWNLQLVCRVLFFCLRTFHRQLVANRMLQPELEEIRDLLRENLTELYNTMGFNLTQLKLVQDLWKDKNMHSFGDLDEPAPKNKKRGLS